MPDPKDEFLMALHEIAYYAPTLDSPYGSNFY